MIFLSSFTSSIPRTEKIESGMQSKGYIDAPPIPIYNGSYTAGYVDGCGQILTVVTTCKGPCSQEEMIANNQAFAANWPKSANGCFIQQ